MKNKVDTKKKILDVSINFFAIQGYKSTSIRMIAKEVGIRESAIYNHYKNKEAILLSVMKEILTLPSPTQKLQEEKIDVKIYLYNYVAEFKEITYDIKNEKLFRMLMIELLQNETIRKGFMESFHAKNVKQLSQSFFIMMQNSLIRSSDPLVVAYEFISTLFYIRLQITLLGIDKKENNFIENMFDKHVDFFWESIKI
jgi:AcrR family transcriptional regulator